MYITMLDLQLLAEGAAAAAAPADGAQNASGAPATPEGSPEGAAAPERKSFDELVKGEYKEEYKRAVEGIVKNRLKGSRETVEKYEKLSPVFDVLGRKYGIDATDPDALIRAVEADNSLYEDEAFKNNMSVDAYKAVVKTQQQNAQLTKELAAAREREQAEQREKAAREQMERDMAVWTAQANEARKKFPNLNLQQELQNVEFGTLLLGGASVERAYVAIHADEIIPSAMEHAAQKGAEAVSSRYASNRSRPTEAGAAQTSPGAMHMDPRNMTKAQRAEIIARVARGEEIKL